MNDFEAMGIMAQEDKDIVVIPTFMGFDKCKQGYICHFGAPHDTFGRLMNSEEYVTVMLMVNKKQLKEVKTRATDGKQD